MPDDGFYYVLFKGEIVGRYKVRARAQAHYAEIKNTLNLRPVQLPPLSPDELRQLEVSTMSNKRLLWTQEDFVRVSKKTQGKKGTRSGG